MPGHKPTHSCQGSVQKNKQDTVTDIYIRVAALYGIWGCKVCLMLLMAGSRGWKTEKTYHKVWNQE